VSSVAGRVARAGSGVYNLTKWGVGAFSEALRQEAIGAGVRVTLIEPGAVATELMSHNSDAVKAIAAKRFEGMDLLQADDIANAIVYALAQPAHVAINEILVRPSRQE
jgi:NADP-dependent 3-hydroxy acid dehydrogenase YdfG